MKKILSVILTLSILTATAQIRVSPTGVAGNSGDSWANATTLEYAVANTTMADQAIWVQAGTYNLTATLVVPQTIRLYGGFAGHETELGQRNFAENPTIIDANNLFAAVTLEYAAVLNGFTVQNGVAHIPARMNGGGVLMQFGSRLENSWILNNTASNLGGGVFVETFARIYNSVIAHNRAGVDGSAVSGDEVDFFSNTVVDNTLLDCDIYTTATFYHTICAGETLTLTASTFGTYLWSTGQTTFSITTAPLTASTTITATITTPTFCVVTNTFEITVNPMPTVTVAVISPLNSNEANPGDEVTFIATGTPTGGAFLWNDIAATTSDTLRVQMPTEGDLQFIVTYTLNGCTATSDMTTVANTNFVPPILDVDDPNTSLTADDPDICLGDSTLLRLNGGIRNSGVWVLYSGSCGGTEVARSIADNPTFWVRPTATTTFFVRGEGGGQAPTECVSVTVTVNPLPLPITGSATVCLNSNVTLNNATTGGGAWSIGLAGGLSLVSETANSATFTGIVLCETTVIFTTPAGCQTIHDIEVLVAPTAIVGDTNFCQGEIRMLTASPFGGTWSTAGGTSVTVNTDGLVTASTTVAGATTIRYTHSTNTSCFVEQIIVVHPQPARPSAAANTVCVGDSIVLNPGSPAGGTWSASPGTHVEFNEDFSRIIGHFAGDVVVRYQLNAHCFDTFHITVLPGITSLSYANEICEGGISTPTALPYGGTWTSTNTAFGTIDATTGVFTGVSAGIFSITYEASNGCARTSEPITVHPRPYPIMGDLEVGVGLTTQLTSSPISGTWTSLNPTIATVSGAGLVTGISAGTATIRYTLPVGSCFREILITVSACATMTPTNPERLTQYLCKNEAILPIQFDFTNATVSQIVWRNQESATISQPPGVEFNSTTHTIYGTPTESGVFHFTVSSFDHASECPAPASENGTLTVNATPGTITVTSDIRCGYVVLSAEGGTGGTIYWQGPTNSGITNTDRASIRDTVTTAGGFVYRAKSAEGCWSEQATYTVTPAMIIAPPTLVLTSGQATLNQIVGMGPLIIPITFERGGSATEVEIFWSWPGTENSTTAPTGIEVSHLAEDTIVITGNLDTFVNNDTIRFRISTVATASCPPLDTIMGVFARTNFCNTATPNWVREQNPDLGWIRWGGSANTDANNDIESGTTLIFGTDGRTSQVWSGAVFAQACGWRGIQFNGGQHGVLNFSADCRHASPALTGNLFSWCAVYRFGDQLCPDGWRVPTAEDFLVLHQNLGFELPNPLGLFIEHGNEGHFMPIEGTSGAPQIGGAWGGARFTGLTDLVDAPSSDYWSSSESWTGLSRSLYFNNVQVWPYRARGKQVGKTVRCVRDTVLPVMQGCNQNLPNWGVLGLGTITWGNTTNTDVSEGATVILGTDGRSDQLWSGAVFASACNKTAFNGGTTGNFTADCRQTYFSVTNRSTGQQGDLFSWCAVMRFGHLLCPEDWRVPTQQDFINLDLNIGGTGQNRSNVPESVARFVGSTGTAREPQISGIWQGTRWTGWTTSPSTNQGSVYWSSNEASAINAFNLSLNPSATNPQNSNPKNIGYALRCVRDVP